MFFLCRAAVPKFRECRKEEIKSLSTAEGNEISVVSVEGDLFFAAADALRDRCRNGLSRVVVLGLRHARCLDATCLMALDELAGSLRDRLLILAEVPEEILKELKSSRILERLGEINVFADDSKDRDLSMARALKRAREWTSSGKSSFR
jgi:SulP family sulfate permease